jgi:phospholipid transport system substrate-binding protein
MVDGTRVARAFDMLTYRRLCRVPLVASIALALIATFAVPAHAGAPTDSLRQSVDQVVKILSDPSFRDNTEARRAQIRKVAENIFNYPETARRALGPHWNGRTPQQQEEFVKLFADLLDRSYVSKIDLYQGERVQYVGETTDGNDATVKTTIATKQGTDIPIDYRMQLKNGRWVVYDVIIEGVSLVSNYRTQFNKIIQTESYDALVQRLRAKETTSEPAASPGRKRGER